ncbi:receptor-type tyrosine-protein phosphatase zeta isoform X2 [Pelobates fuscus]|uniref:receptor-type tyrosine-protein phosphatase zeta isoform X2 n=1 Tax=Pelobates fuscus TaxID=191477 RepID=UPI002FE472B0
MLNLGCFQLLLICQVGLAFGYYRHQRKLIEEIDWSYTESLNQTNWVKKYPACSGAKQSPINIDEDLTKLNMNLKKLSFQGWEQLSSNSALIRNTGKTVEINLTDDYFLSGGALNTKYKASRITFHWGKCNATSDGSEHSLEGEKFPLEMQIFCYDNDQFKSFDDAVSGNGKLKALSILFKVGPEDNPNYDVIINGVNSVHRFGKRATMEPFVLLNLLPSYTDKYYTYNGSLTAPPCTETVEWIVFKDTVTISESQLESFCEVLTMQQSGYVMVMDYLQNNFRHQQYMFVGQVFSSYTGTEEITEPVCSSEPDDVRADARNNTSLLITWKRPRVVYDGMIERYLVYYQQLEGEDQTKHEFLTDGYQDLGAILLNLLPNTSYVLQVVAICSNSLYGKRSDQVIVDMTDGAGNDPFLDFIETEEDIEDSEETQEERENRNPEKVLSTISSVNQIHGQRAIATTTVLTTTTSRYIEEEIDSQKSATEKAENKLHSQAEVYKVFLYPTSQPTTKTSADTTVASSAEFVKLTERPQQILQGTTYKITDLKSSVDLWMLNITGTTKGTDENDVKTNAVTEQPITTTSWKRRMFLPTKKLSQVLNDTSVSTQAMFSTTVTPEITSQGNTISLQSPKPYTIKDVSSLAKEAIVNTSSSPINEFDSSNTTKETPLPSTPPDDEMRSSSSSIHHHDDELGSTPSSKAELYIATILTEGEMPNVSTSTFSPIEASFQSISPRFGQHGSAFPVTEVLSQTTESISNGETPLQPSYTSEVFSLVTPLLSDAPLLQASATASDNDLILHATPLFSTVNLSFEPTLSSFDEVPLLTFSSSSSSSILSGHLCASSEMFLPVTQAVASETLSMHVSLALTKINALVQPSHTQYSDVKLHQTDHAASETLTLGYKGNSFDLSSQLENPSTDFTLHVLSTAPEPIFTLSSEVISTHFTANTYDSEGVFHQGTLNVKPSTELFFKPSTVMFSSDTLLQPTRSTISDEENTETYSGSGFFFYGIDNLTAQEVASSGAGDEATYIKAELNQNKPTVQSHPLVDHDTGLQTTSFNGKVTSLSEHEIIADLHSSNVISENKSSQGMPPVSLSTTRSLDSDINAISEYLLPVQPFNAISTFSGDISLNAMLPNASKTVSASSDMLILPTQELIYEMPAKPINEAVPQSMLQLSNVNVASDGVLNETSHFHHSASNVGLVLSPSSADTVDESTLSSTYVQSVGNPLYPDFPGLSHSQPTMSVLHDNDVAPSMLTSINYDEIILVASGNDVRNQPLEIVPSFFTAFSHSISTPMLPTNTLIQQDASTLYHDLRTNAYPSHGIPIDPSSTKDSAFYFTTSISNAPVPFDNSVTLPNVYVSVTADSPNSESPSTLKMLTSAPKSATGLLTTVSSDSETGYSVVDDGIFVIAGTDSTSHTESPEGIVADTSNFAHKVLEGTTLSMSEYSNLSEEGSGLSAVPTQDQANLEDMKGRSHLTSTSSASPSTAPEKHNHAVVLETHIHTAETPAENVSESSSWSMLTSDEESGSGPSTPDSLSDNETSTDFNFSDTIDRDKDFEVAIEPGKADLTPGSEITSPSSVTSDRSTVANVSEAEASNSSHESRIGLAEGLGSEKKTLIPLVVVSLLTFICLVVLVGILIYWRKCFQTAHFYLEDNTSPRVISSSPIPVFPVSDDIGAVPIKQFPKHVRELHSKNGFTEEFEEVQNCTADLGITSDSSNHPDNKNKNRYINIVAYDHSRVKLSQLAEKDGKATDYINANYVDGYKKPKAYIAAQGPLKSTAEDFWRMVWEHNVELIVMITNLVEKGRRKCDQYWPSDGNEEYGGFLITQKSTHVLAYYTVRTFTIGNTKTKKGSQKGRMSERTVTQYHYTQWPDMGVPEYSLPVLTFVRKAAATKSNSNGPVVVHCSAGVGRTGTYIVLDSMLQQIQQEGTVNIFGFLKHIRSQRNYLVQTEEQYIFIHDALVEAILSRETEVPENQIHAYVNALLTTGPSGKSRLETQFKLLSEPNILQCDYSTALKQQNRDKNRTSSVMPVERSRVGLSSLAGEGTDYINASYVMGYQESNEFIITQHPLLHTIKDFWRMIWDHNSQIIVMLPDNQNMAEDEFVYWPNKDEPIACENFTVSMVGEDHMCLSNEEKLIIQDFLLEATQDDYVLEVRHFQCPKWPNPDSPISKTFEMINLIKEEAANKDGPIIVHDEYGGVTAGTFCALNTLLNQLENENSVDVYQVTKMINLMRPGVFTDIDQYQFLFKAILSLVSTRQEESPLACMESNGSALPDGNTSESLESLV